MEITRARRVMLMDDAGERALQYSRPKDTLPLRKFIVEKMSRYGIVADVDNVVITTGSQQALDLIGKILLESERRDPVRSAVVSSALQAFAAYQRALHHSAGGR